MFEDVKLVLNGVEVPGLSWRDVNLPIGGLVSGPQVATISFIVDGHRYEYDERQADPVMIIDGHSTKT